ncbi:MAG: hypothetical protein EU539_09640 [Promethearchaeota archaeon]|nr:MAG: hypothetical protein EU539_09640 [Candidatus Lokiarchaeota archaeon]
MKIFLILFDTLRKDHAGKTYGNEWIRTPHFDDFAKDAIVFDKAYAESLPTIPARRAIHTGIRTFPFTHKKPELRTDDPVKTPGWYPIPPQHIHMSEYLRSEAFTTAFITSAYHHFKPYMNFHLGYDQWNFIRGHENDKLRARYRAGQSELKKKIKEHSVSKDPAARTYQKYVLRPHFNNVQDRKNEEDYFPAKTINTALEFVRDTIYVKNTFCFIDEFDPHEPWDPPLKYLNLYVDKNYKGRKIITPAYRQDIDYLLDGELKYMRASYAGEVSMCDRWFGHFINELKQLELYDDSLIILTSDHGHSIGEHDATGKIPMFLYPELVDIPLMIKPPGGLKGPKRVKNTYVYHHDILPTFFGFIEKEIPDALEGIDLSIFLDQKDQLLSERDYITCGFGIYTLYKDDNYALISSNDQEDQKLFDLSKDPEWNNNIAQDNKDVCDDLFKKIEHDANGELIVGKLAHGWELEEWYSTKKSSLS